MESSMRLLEQARFGVTSSVNVSKSLPLDRERSESSNTQVEKKRAEQALQDFQKSFNFL